MFICTVTVHVLFCLFALNKLRAHLDDATCNFCKSPSTGALKLFAQNAPPSISTPHTDTEVTNADKETCLADMKLVQHRLIGEAKTSKKTDRADNMQHARLHIHLNNAGNATAQVVYASDDPASPKMLQQIEAFNKHMREGGRPPYIKTVNPPDCKGPSVEATVQLFKLCPEQEFPFRLLAATMHDENDNKQDIDQLLLTINGGPGNGKSEVLAAFLWYAFQHDCSHMVAVVSFT